MSDTWMGVGIVHRGEPVAIATSILYDALVACNPYKAYTLAGMSTQSHQAHNDGTGTDDILELWENDAPATFTGPDGNDYPELARADRSDPDFCYAKVDDNDINAYDDGRTIIVVYHPLGGGAADDGIIFSAVDDSNTHIYESIGLLSLSRVAGTTYIDTEDLGDVANQTFKNFVAGTVPSDEWIIFEVYFPPGDSQPIIYQNGLVIVPSDTTEVDTAARFDYGANALEFLLGTNYPDDPLDAADANGYYAFLIAHEGELSFSCRNAYRQAAIEEGWIEQGAFSELYNILLGCDPIYSYNFDGWNQVSDVVPNDGWEGSSHDAVIQTADAPEVVLGPEGGSYPEFGDNGGAGENSWAKVEAEVYPDGYTDGMTWIVVYMPQQSNEAHGVANGGDIVYKNRGSGNTNLAEHILNFSGGLYGARNAQSLNLAAHAANRVDPIFTDIWWILEVYFPPGNVIPTLYLNGVEVTGADLNTNSFGARADHGSGELIIGGQENGGSADACGFYAFTVFYEGEISAGCRSNYMEVATQEGWIMEMAEEISLNSNDATGETTVGSYDEVFVIVIGSFTFYTGSGTADADVQYSGGSEPAGHQPAFTFWDGSTWVHEEPLGGPYTPSTTGGGTCYIFEKDGGGAPLTFRIGDSVHSDNVGTFTVQIWRAAT